MGKEKKQEGGDGMAWYLSFSILAESLKVLPARARSAGLVLKFLAQFSLCAGQRPGRGAESMKARPTLELHGPFVRLQGVGSPLSVGHSCTFFLQASFPLNVTLARVTCELI